MESLVGQRALRMVWHRCDTAVTLVWHWCDTGVTSVMPGFCPINPAGFFQHLSLSYDDDDDAADGDDDDDD